MKLTFTPNRHNPYSQYKALPKGSFARLRAQAGFTLVEIMMVVFAIVALLGILALALGPVRTMIFRSLCIANQHTVQDAVRTWAAGNDLNYGATLASTAIIGTGLLVPVAPTCRNGGTYTYTGTVPAVGTRYATCSVSGDAPSSTVGW